MTAKGILFGLAAWSMILSPGWCEPLRAEPAVPAERTLQPEYFVRHLCTAVHSLSFDAKGGMWVGCLAETAAELGKPGVRKIYRIAPDGTATWMHTVDCAVTALRMGLDDKLYVGCDVPVKIFRITKDGKQEHLTNDGTYHFSLHDDGKLAYAGNGRTFQITPDGAVTPVLESDGLWDRKSNLIYRHAYCGPSLERREIRSDRTVGRGELIAESPCIKGMMLHKGGALWILGHDGAADYVCQFQDGKLRERVRLKVSAWLPEEQMQAMRAEDLPRHFVNAASFGEGAFGTDTIYFATWSGDILRVKL